MNRIRKENNGLPLLSKEDQNKLINKINEKVWKELDDQYLGTDLQTFYGGSFQQFKNPYTNNTSQFWTREHIQTCYEIPRLSKLFGIRKLIVGHDPSATQQTGKVRQMCRGHLIMADTGMSRGYRSSFMNAQIAVTVFENHESNNGKVRYENISTGDRIEEDLISPMLL